MVVHRTPEQEEELAKLAGRNGEELTQAVIGYYLDHAVCRSFVSHEEVGARIEPLFRT